MPTKIDIDRVLPSNAVKSATTETPTERILRLIVSDVPQHAAALALLLGLIFAFVIALFKSGDGEKSAVQLLVTIVGAAGGYLFAVKSRE
jgi:hypothetical protein